MGESQCHNPFSSPPSNTPSSCCRLQATIVVAAGPPVHFVVTHTVFFLLLRDDRPFLDHTQRYLRSAEKMARFHSKCREMGLTDPQVCLSSRKVVSYYNSASERFLWCSSVFFFSSFPPFVLRQCLHIDKINDRLHIRDSTPLESGCVEAFRVSGRGDAARCPAFRYFCRCFNDRGW